MATFPANSMRSRKGVSREDDFYLDIENKKDFLDYYTIDHGCTDLQIKFFKSVMDGRLKFVKHALNIGSIRKEYDTMRAAINLACRFGQPQVLDCLLQKVHDNFFRAQNLNFIAVVVAGISEARRLEANQEPSGILDTLIKYSRKSFDQRKSQWVNGKIEMDWSAFGKYDTTPFMELCGSKGRCMGYVIKKILDADTDSHLLNVNKVIEETSYVGTSALTTAVMTGEQEVIGILLDKMKWERREDLDKSDKHHIQSVLAGCIDFLSDPHYKEWHEKTTGFAFSERKDMMDIIHILIEKCFRSTQKNGIGHNNAGLMDDLNKLFVHEHFSAMIYEVIDEERRIADASGKITWYDLYNLKVVEGPWTKEGHGPDGTKDRNFYADQMKRYLRSSEKNKVTVGIPSTMYIDILLTELEKKEKCWSCGYQEPELLVCKQCRKARYCDALCQEEDWSKHRQWCCEQKNQMKLERHGKTVEDEESRKAMRKRTKTGLDEISMGWFQVTTAFQMLCHRAHEVEYS